MPVAKTEAKPIGQIRDESQVLCKTIQYRAVLLLKGGKNKDETSEDDGNVPAEVTFVLLMTYVISLTIPKGTDTEREAA